MELERKRKRQDTEERRVRHGEKEREIGSWRDGRQEEGERE